MAKHYNFIDSDAHVSEPQDMFEHYLEPKYRAQMPVAWAHSQGEPRAFGLEMRVPKPAGGAYVRPLGHDPLTGGNRLDTQAHLAAFDGGAGVPLPGHDDAYAAFARQGFPPEMYALAMAHAGIDYMVVYPTTGILAAAVPDLSAATAAAYRRAYNNWLHDFCAAAGSRVLGAAAVDLRDAEEAAREARRCVREFDFKAVYINPVPVGEHRLYDDFYEPLWNTLEDLDVPLAIHTGTGNAADPMLHDYLPRLRTAQTTVACTIGNMLACTALIMGGVLEQHPRLRVVHLESGAGWVPFWLDRLATSVQDGLRGLDISGLTMHPVEYFQRQCFIAADQDDPGIQPVIAALGDDNLVTATDFGHPEGRRYTLAVQEILALPVVSLESKQKMMWDNALRLYPIRP